MNLNWAAIWSRLSSLGFVMFSGIVAVGVALVFLPPIHQRASMQSELYRLDTEIARQEALEKKQQIEIEALKTDPSFVERTARDKLNLARPNEVLFRFEPVPAPAAPSR